MKKFLVLAFLFSWSALAAQVKLQCDPNTEPDLAGYKVYWGTTSRVYTNSADTGLALATPAAYTITGLTEGVTYYFAATAYDAVGNESGYSNEVSYRVASVPNPPGNLHIVP